MPEYKKVEEKIFRVVADVYGLSYPEPLEIKKADLAVLSAEREQVLLPSYGPWFKDFPSPAPICIDVISWVQAKEQFSSQIQALLKNRS